MNQIYLLTEHKIEKEIERKNRQTDTEETNVIGMKIEKKFRLMIKKETEVKRQRERETDGQERKAQN